jgi:hypothetical protein
MRKTIAVIISLLFIFALAPASFVAGADELSAVTDNNKDKDKDKKKKKATSHKKVKQVTGNVTAADAAAKYLTVDGITIMADQRMLADIKRGDRVTVKYITRGVNTAIIIIPE